MQDLPEAHGDRRPRVDRSGDEGPRRHAVRPAPARGGPGNVARRHRVLALHVPRRQRAAAPRDRARQRRRA